MTPPLSDLIFTVKRGGGAKNEASHGEPYSDSRKLPYIYIYVYYSRPHPLTLPPLYPPHPNPFAMLLAFPQGPFFQRQ